MKLPALLLTTLLLAVAAAPANAASRLTVRGAGFGHGVGMSQYGAQGWATGASGPALTGEQIIQKYYTGTQITQMPTTGENTGIRVLLSTPSSTGIYTCGSPAMNVSLADVKGWGAVRILNEGAGNALIANFTFSFTVAP